jgi:hypothetical protein
MLGNAMFTMVESRTTISCAPAMTASASPDRLAAGDRFEPAGASSRFTRRTLPAVGRDDGELGTMATSGLAGKLGVTADNRTLVLGPAPDAVLAELFDPNRRATSTPYDVIVAFCADRKALTKHAPSLPTRLTTTGGLWLLWIKKASGVATDIGEADVRAAGLETGLVDNKIAAIDETWSGLRFVRRLADR